MLQENCLHIFLKAGSRREEVWAEERAGGQGAEENMFWTIVKVLKNG